MKFKVFAEKITEARRKDPGSFDVNLGRHTQKTGA